MKTLSIALLLSLASAIGLEVAQAKIPEGTWKGVISAQADCFLDVGAETYEGGLVNPLNKRVAVTIGNQAYLLRHPYVIQSAEGKVSVDQDRLEGVLATRIGAFAVQMTLEHSQGVDRPTHLTVMEDDWRSGNSEAIECGQLRRVYP